MAYAEGSPASSNIYSSLSLRIIWDWWIKIYKDNPVDHIDAKRTTTFNSFYQSKMPDNVRGTEGKA